MNEEEWLFKFQKLEVWEKAFIFCNEILDLADKLPKIYQYSLASQLRDSAISIPANIAEGTGRRSKREQSNFFNIAKASTYETVNFLIILTKRKFINKKEFISYYQKAEIICKMLSGLIKRE